MSDEEVKVVTKAEIPTKIFYYINEVLEVEEIVPEGILPDSLDNSHENKYYYNDAKNKLYLVIKNNNETYEAKEVKAEGILPDPINILLKLSKLLFNKTISSYKSSVLS